jgi:sugar lactone lactonase YvrE
LLKIDFKNNYKIEVLTNEADGIPFRFTDHLDVASDGKIYFTDASSKYGPGRIFVRFVRIKTLWKISGI